MEPTNLPTESVTNEQYRAARGTDGKAKLGGAMKEWRRLYGPEIKRARRLRKLLGKSWRWHESYQPDGD